MIKKWIKCILGFCLSGLRFWNLGFNLKGEIMLKSAKQGLQWTWASRGWRLGHSGDLGAQIVAPKWLFLGGLASDDGIDVIFGIQGVLTWRILMFQIVLIL